MIIIYDKANAFNPPLQPPPGPGMKVDSIAGPFTFRWIKHFQEEAKRRGHPTVTDGQVSPANGTLGAIAGKPYTIIRMSVAYFQVRPTDYSNIARAADRPPALGAALSV